MSDPIFKILSRAEWEQAQRDNVFHGSEVDLEDGYIHFSTADQVCETASKHFAGRSDLLLLRIDTDACDARSLKWEPSRGGALFPHLYASLSLTCVTHVDPLPFVDGKHRFPDDVERGPERAT